MMRRLVVGLLGAVGFSLLATGALADTASLYLPPAPASEPPADLGRVHLAADRNFGFAPLTVNLSGMLEGANGSLIPMNGGQKVRVIVEAPFMRVQSGTGVSSLVSSIHYEAVTPGPASPAAYHRALEIKRPGTYSFRVQVIAPDGRVLNSNEVSVRVL